MAAAAMTAGLAACTQDKSAADSSVPPLQLTSANLSDVTTAIQDRALTRPVTVDDTLRLAPSTTPPKATEADALSRWSRLFTTTNGGATNIAVVHADATSTIPVGTPDTKKPSFKNVPSWAIVTTKAATTSHCPAIIVTGSGPPTESVAPYTPVLDITLVADDGSGRIVSYSTRGKGQCPSSEAHEPHAETATTPTSVPWRYTKTGVRAPGYRTLVRDTVVFTLPPCSFHTGRGQTPAGNVINAEVYEVGTGATCAMESDGTAKFQRLKTMPLGAHAPTGPSAPPLRWPVITDGTPDPATPTPSVAP